MPKTQVKAKKAKAVGTATALIPEKAVPSADTAIDDTAWLDSGYLNADATGIDPKLAQIPGRFEPAVPIDDIVPNPWNPNVEDKKMFDMLVRRMREIGNISPAQVVPMKDGKFMLLGGEHRWRAAKAIGYATMPCIVLTEERFENEDLQKFITMQLNMIGGDLDPEKFVTMYADLAKRYDDKALKDLMGFTKDHKFKMLTKGIAEGLPEGMQQEFERRAASAKSPDELQSILSEIMGKYGDDLRFNFMVISHDGREHVWLKLNDKVHPLAMQMLDLCRTRAVDINVVLEEAINHVITKFTE